MISFEKPLSAPNGAPVNFHAVTRAEVGPDADAITLYISSWPSRAAWMEGHEPVAYAAPRVEFAQLPTCGAFMDDVVFVITSRGLLEGALPVVDQPPEEQLRERAAHLARVQRDALLAQCDWRVVAASESGFSLAEPWREYRRALRDITKQPGFPSAIEWPVAPT